MKMHELKCWPEFFEPMRTGEKRCDLRYDDRGFAVGDMLNLREWDPGRMDYTGRVLLMRVTHILYSESRGPYYIGLGLAADWVVLSVMRAN